MASETPKYGYLGSLVKKLREQFGSDVIGKKMTQKAFMAGLRDEGYGHLNTGAGASEFEQGGTLPRDPKKFLDAASEVLRADPEEARMLVLSLGMDVLKDAYDGEDGVNQFFADMHKIGGPEGFRKRYASLTGQSQE